MVKERVDAGLGAGGPVIAEEDNWDEAYAKRLLPTVLLGVIAFSSSMTIVSAALPTIATDLDSTEATLAWSVTGLFLAMAIGTPIMGKIGDIYGHRRVFLSGATVLTVGTLLCGLAFSAGTFIGARMIVGVGIAATMPTANSLVLQSFPPSRRSVAMGWFQMAMTGAPVIGLVIGGPMIEAWGWETVFFMLTPVAAAGLVLSFLVIRRTPPGPRVPIDWAGGATLGLGTLGFLLGLEQLNSRGLTDPGTVGLFVGAVISLAIFVRIERRTPRPLLRLDYFKRRTFSGTLSAQGLAQFAYMGGFLLSPLLLDSVFGLGVSAIALLLLFRPGLFSVMSPFGGRLAVRYGQRRLILTGAVVMVVSMIAFSLSAVLESLPIVVAGLALSGLAMGLAAPNYMTAVAGAVEPQDMGVATGMATTMMNIGMLTGIQVMFVLLGDARTTTAFASVYLFGGAVAVLGIVGASLVQNPAPSTSPGSAANGSAPPAQPAPR